MLGSGAWPGTGTVLGPEPQDGDGAADRARDALRAEMDAVFTGECRQYGR